MSLTKVEMRSKFHLYRTQKCLMALWTFLLFFLLFFNTTDVQWDPFFICVSSFISSICVYAYMHIYGIYFSLYLFTEIPNEWGLKRSFPRLNDDTSLWNSSPFSWNRIEVMRTGPVLAFLFRETFPLIQRRKLRPLLIRWFVEKRKSSIYVWFDLAQFLM